MTKRHALKKNADSHLAALDHQFVWHPFTQMRDWLKREPIVITSGHGAILRDTRGREYLDANSSIWTNLHGHRHPKINAAIGRQLHKVAHSSALGLANEPASLLARDLMKAANPGGLPRNQPKLAKVFYSDDGSTAMEASLKMAHQCAMRRGHPAPRFLSLSSAYHGDTIGAVSLGHIDRFHKAYAPLLFKTEVVAAPYCYRCPFNRAKPERADAREYRKCNWECVDAIEKKFALATQRSRPYTAFVFEPLMQGAAGMIPQPEGWLRRVAPIVRSHGALLLADEVMTGFGRTGGVFASHREGVQPDLMALAKGMTGGYLPMAATLVTQKIFDAFLGEHDECKTFYHGHSYTANQLGAAASLASLSILQSQKSIKQRDALASSIKAELSTLWDIPSVGDIRQVGLVAGVELVKNWKTRESFPAAERVGQRVCEAMARRGVLSRPIGDVIVLMPPYCTTPAQVRKIIVALRDAMGAIG
jgi:adenosylmethionine-8-amino-7-oxononanoate aminotransferase